MVALIPTTLLEWSTRNSNLTNGTITAPSDNSPSVNSPSVNSPSANSSQPIDSKWLDVIMGKSDALLLKELRLVLTEKSTCVESLVSALVDVEMYVESLDNANGKQKVVFIIN